MLSFVICGCCLCLGVCTSLFVAACRKSLLFGFVVDGRLLFGVGDVVGGSRLLFVVCCCFVLFVRIVWSVHVVLFGV